MTTETLICFGLPETFPPELMPDAGAQFVADCVVGMTADQLLAFAEERGFDPIWRKLDHMGPNVYGLGLNIEGLAVPLMVKMTGHVQ